MLTRFTSIFFRAAAASLLSFSLPASAAGNVIAIGHAIDLSGTNVSLGCDYVAGFKTCFDMVNAADGIHGKRILYLTREAATTLSSYLDIALFRKGSGQAPVLALMSIPISFHQSHSFSMQKCDCTMTGPQGQRANIPRIRVMHAPVSDSGQ